MTQLRAKRSTSTPLKRAAQLERLRIETMAMLGDRYTASIAPFQPLIRRAAPQFGCVIAAAGHLVEQLGAEGNDPAIKRLMTCAAVELALAS